MNPQELHIHEQWSMSITPELRSETEKIFLSGRAAFVPRADPELVRIARNNARTRATAREI